MTADATGPVLLTPGLEQVVDRWRQRYDPVAAFGMPAHVTVLYPWLDPQPGAPIIDLVERVVDRWPAYPPFAGRFPDVVPHLTLADGRDPTALSDLVADVEPRLPLCSTVAQLSLMRLQSDGWVADAQFPFGN